MKKVFISYSLKPCAGACALPNTAGECPGSPDRQCRRPAAEQAFLTQLVDRLRKNFDVLWDRSVLYAGDEWRQKLYPCFGQSHAAVILLTEGAFASHFVPLESMVLMWRKVLNPNMLVTPVYFGAINENRLKDPNSLFYGVGLEDLQAVKHSGDDTAAIDAIERSLGKIAEPAPLEEIAVLHRLAGLLEDALDQEKDAAAATFGEALQDWGVPKALQLALSALRRGLTKSLQALNRFSGKDRRKGALSLLAPMWVDLRAAAPLWSNRGIEAQKKIHVVNGRNRKTAEHYIARAWCHTFDNWRVLRISAVSAGLGPGSLKEEVLRAYWIEWMDHEVNPQWDSEAAEMALGAIQQSNVPLYVIFEWTEGFDPEELPDVQRDIPEITILYLCNNQRPTAPAFLEAAPEITPQIEKTALTEYQAAFGVLGR